ncbi:glutamate-cysteine ligase family protein [Eggerthella sinensis]|uniref:Glutamate--cysteine ligase n=1 Tax=Eggerthella sinensis TaxID=242230 RepID=A0A3N0IXD1_9ACTN|nr:glutamate-cysteine ligase family protein [Eggerthella sinensis]RDB66856.1 glutamate--cysteine ligase [Eggerthella sinensis]RNM41653.1 glutamate--cysteine ligase [Eggerthella sinensis]
MNKTAATGQPSPSSPTAAQPARESNIDAIVSFFESGIKPFGGPGELGIELEQIIVHDDLSPVSYSDEHGVAWVLRQLQQDYPRTTTDEHGDLLGVSRPSEAVTIEPAAQIELSAGPFADLATASDAFVGFVQRLAAILEPVGEKALPMGYHPTATARSLELIPKRRYQFMNLYLGERDTYGPCMMRGSASTQVSIDYTSTADCLRKLRLAFALVPVLSLICDNTPVFEGKPREHQLVRTDIWQHVDNDRCGLVPDVLDPAFDLRRYAEYILDTVAILIPCHKEQWCYSDRTFGDIYATRTMTRAEVEHAVSMFFTDVRLKTYIEIRPADAMPIPYVIAYAALIKGLFYAPASLDALDELFAEVRRADYLAAQGALMERGYEAEVYGMPVAELCDRVMAIGKDGLAEDEQLFLEPLADLVARRVTLADLAERGEEA